MDRLTKEERSRNMARIRGKDTKPELLVRSLLHGMGYRFRLHRKDLPGKPDIVLPKYESVVLVHGCFWHRHKGCQYAYMPKTRVSFWKKKFKENIDRDKNNLSQLEELGWNVLTVWECETRDLQKLKDRLQAFLEAG